MDQAALRQALRCGDAKVIANLHKLIDNIVEHPSEEKFRKLKLDNKTVQALMSTPGVERFLHSAGFEASEVNPSILFMPAPSTGVLQLLARERERIQYEISACLEVSQREKEQQRPSSPTSSQIIPAAMTTTPVPTLVPSGKGPRLVVFDFDGTITIDSHVADFGLAGERLNLLSTMADRLLGAGICTVLVTAQRIYTTRYHTVPLLRSSGLVRLFSAPDVASDAAPEQLFYRDNPRQGAIYTGQEAWNKMTLIRKIIAGENRWCCSFDCSQVLYVDDSAEQLNPCKCLNIHLRHVRQDGMNAEDVEFVEHFASA